MKKFVLLIFMLVYCCAILSCSSADNNDYMTPAEQAEIWGEQVLDSFIKQDKATLKGLFNQNMHQKYNLDNRLQECFDYIDGEIISYGEIFGDAGGGEISAEEGTVKKTIFCKIKDIKTDKGTTYNIYFSAYIIYKDDEDYLGIDGISIRNVDLFAEDSENPEAELTLSYDK